MNNFITALNSVPYAVFISAELNANSADENALATTELKTKLVGLGLDFDSIRGHYNDADENSFVVFCSSNDDVIDLINLGLDDFNQESVMVLNTQYQTVALHFGDKRTRIGTKLVEVTDIASIEKLPNYSLIDNRYYVVQ